MDHKINWPRITIITPSYNQGEFIEDTIKSILNQNYPNLEYFIVDGGSTDNTIEIIRKYEDKIDWWVSEPDRGQSHAINKGLKRATGEIINWINSDDLLFPGALTRIANCYRKHDGQVDIMAGDIARIKADGAILRIMTPSSPLSVVVKHHLISLGQQGSFFTQKTVSRYGLLNEDLHAIMDAEFYFRVLHQDGKLVRLQGLIGAIREHPRAKGCAQKEMWAQEIDRFRCNFNHREYFFSLIRLRLMRMLDGSYLRSFLLTIKYSGRRISSRGWI